MAKLAERVRVWRIRLGLAAIFIKTTSVKVWFDVALVSLVMLRVNYSIILGMISLSFTFSNNTLFVSDTLAAWRWVHNAAA